MKERFKKNEVLLLFMNKNVKIYNENTDVILNYCKRV